jgi:hypothetical protein
MGFLQTNNILTLMYFMPKGNRLGFIIIVVLFLNFGLIRQNKGYKLLYSFALF